VNHHKAAVGIILSLLLTIIYLFDRGPYSAFAYTFVALPMLVFCVVFYYFREVLRELRHRDVL
jgi:uncharacterized membrane protein